MARRVLTNAVVIINSTNWSDYVASVTVEETVEEVTTTAFGNSGVTRVGGLRDDSISLDFHQSFDSNDLDQTLQGLLGGTASIEILTNGTAVGTANPKWTGTVLITEWGFEGGVGELATKSVTWPVSGVLVRGTA